MMYFRKRICKLQILREYNNALFKHLKIIVDEIMVQIGSLCKDRFAQILSEAMGAELSSRLESVIRQADVNAVVNEKNEENTGDLRPLVQEWNISLPASPKLWYDGSQNGTAVAEAIDKQNQPMDHVTCIPSTIINPLEHKLSDQNIIEPLSRRELLLYNCAGLPAFYNQVNRRFSGINESIPYRQDHEKVGAIRVLGVDEQEALLQSHGVGVFRSIKANGSSRLSCISANLDEEIFLAQLALRAKLLNDEFQEEVIRIVATHCNTVVERNQSGSLAADASTNRIVGFLCDFGDHCDRVEVHSAKPKAVLRMREKLHKYANPHPRSEWPLCANILDPVRASIVCRGASQILKVLSWFTEQQDSAGLPICRMKNKFSFPAELVPDGYRDLQICVLFRGSSGLSIIGEIQIHDAELHDLKLKMHKLYVIRRAESPDVLML